VTGVDYPTAVRMALVRERAAAIAVQIESIPESDKEWLAEHEFSTRYLWLSNSVVLSRPESRSARGKRYSYYARISAKRARHIQIHRVISRSDRATVLARGKCEYCGRLATVVDHVIPVSRGGTKFLYNLAAACEDCNSSKSDLILWEEWMPPNALTIALGDGLPTRQYTD
jgi:5-methylcytosine-specific restriction endonuclease McrA